MADGAARVNIKVPTFNGDEATLFRFRTDYIHAMVKLKLGDAVNTARPLANPVPAPAGAEGQTVDRVAIATAKLEAATAAATEARTASHAKFRLQLAAEAVLRDGQQRTEAQLRVLTRAKDEAEREADQATTLVSVSVAAEKEARLALQRATEDAQGGAELQRRSRTITIEEWDRQDQEAWIHLYEALRQQEKRIIKEFEFKVPSTIPSLDKLMRVLIPDVRVYTNKVHNAIANFAQKQGESLGAYMERAEEIIEMNMDLQARGDEARLIHNLVANLVPLYDHQKEFLLRMEEGPPKRDLTKEEVWNELKRKEGLQGEKKKTDPAAAKSPALVPAMAAQTPAGKLTLTG